MPRRSSAAQVSSDWRGRAWEEAVVYELHVGAFTPEGTFRGAIGKLDHLVALGVTALEIMPVADFPGERNWGYDGVLPYAPDGAYGRPDLVIGESYGYASGRDPRRVDWCRWNYRSYDPRSGYYRAYSGRLIFCG